MVKNIITKSFNIASENNIPCISDCMMHDEKVLLFSYKHNLKSFIKEALKSCDKLHKSEREKRTRSIVEEIKSRPGHNPGRVIFSSARSQQTENTKRKFYAISEEKLIELISDQNKLDALECGGVDNWPYYSESQHEYVSEYDEYEDLDEAFAAYSKNEIENDGVNYMPIKDDKLAEAIYTPFDEEELDR
ncbi:MAG: hypothetical protein IJ772_04375 [Bacilli bacterium]|nr:hypothetical protein [Bacilli bacterium]